MESVITQLSINHLSEETRTALSDPSHLMHGDIVVYPKIFVGDPSKCYGYLIVADDSVLASKHVTEDLKILAAYAIAKDAYYLEVDSVFGMDTKLPIHA